MMRILKFFDAVPLPALFPTCAFVHSDYSASLTDVPLSGLLQIIADDEEYTSTDTSRSSMRRGDLDCASDAR